MTKKDYIEIVNILKTIPNIRDYERAHIVRHFADCFQRANPRFNRDVFFNTVLNVEIK
jgi:hypothetical protein